MTDSKPRGGETLTGQEIQELAYAAFDRWRDAQPEEIQGMGIIEQIALYAAAN